MSLPFVASHTCTVLSLLPKAMYLPSRGDHATAFSPKACPGWVKSCPPIPASQICTVPSLPAEAMRVPLGDQVSDCTPNSALVCPRYVVMRLPLSVGSQTCARPSVLPEAMRVPSGDHATASTKSLCP